jgi:hypothetical protein
MDVPAAHARLAELTELQEHGRRRLGVVSFPLVLLGVVYLGAAPAVLLIHRDHLGPYFAITFIVVAIASARHFRRRDDLEGVAITRWPLLCAIVLTLFLAATVSRAGIRLDAQFMSTVGPWLINALFFVGFGIATRSRFLVKIGILLVAASLGSVVLAEGDTRVAIEAILFAAIVLAVTLSDRVTGSRR